MPSNSVPPRLAVISDIHSNLEALKAVLQDIQSQGVTKIVCLGDIVGYAADPESCLESIRTLECPVIMGNHDEASCLHEPSIFFNDTAREGVLFSAKQLSQDQKNWLLSLPNCLTLDGITFLHASLDFPEDWNYILSGEDAEAHFANQSTNLAFCGHTHTPLLWISQSTKSLPSQLHGKGILTIPSSGKSLVNVGSVGQPRDEDNRACYVIYNPDRNTVEFRRVTYPIEITRQKILSANLPTLTADRLLEGI